MMIINELLRFIGLTSPAISKSGEATLYYDNAADQLKISSNANGYLNLLNDKFLSVNPNGQIQHQLDSLSFSATTNIDFTGKNYKTIPVTGDLTFTTSNLAAGRSISIRLVPDGSNHNLTFPGWHFLGSAAPTSITASKIAVISLVAYGSTNADVVAAYSAEQ